jgi:hypothetical protein
MAPLAGPECLPGEGNTPNQHRQRNARWERSSEQVARAHKPAGRQSSGGEPQRDDVGCAREQEQDR